MADDWVVPGGANTKDKHDDWVVPGTTQQTENPDRGVVDKLFGLTGERYQTWPERAIRGSLESGAELTKKSLTGEYGPTGQGIYQEDPGKIISAASLGVTAAPEAGLQAARVFETGSRARQTSSALKEEASPEKIKESSQSLYGYAEKYPLQIKPDVINDFVAQTQGELRKKLVTPNRAEGTYSALEQMKEGDGNVVQLMDAREALGEMTPADGKDYFAANHVIKKIDSFLDGLQKEHVISGDPQYTKTLLERARASWRPYAKLTEIEKGVEVAGHRAGSTGTAANMVNTLRQEMRKILDSDKKSRGYSPEAKAKLEEIVDGVFATNLARKVSKYAPTGSVAAIPTILAYLGRGKLAAAGLAGAGFLGKYLGEALTRDQIGKLEDLIAAESPLGRSIVKRIQEQPNDPLSGGIQAAAPAAAPMLAAGGASLLAAGADSPLAQPGN
jgi:hypothetical protein